MKVSVIITARDCESVIAETIESVLDQGDCLHEIIIVDDCCHDETVSVVLSFCDPRIKIMQNGGRGAAAAHLTGAAASQGEALFFAAAEMPLQPDMLANLIQGQYVQENWPSRPGMALVARSAIPAFTPGTKPVKAQAS